MISHLGKELVSCLPLQLMMVFLDVNLPVLTEDTHARVRGTQIDTDGGSHFV
jgi:hypothetical protein